MPGAPKHCDESESTYFIQELRGFLGMRPLRKETRVLCRPENVLRFMRPGEPIQLARLSNAMGVSTEPVCRLLRTMASQGRVERVGKGLWRVAAEAPEGSMGCEESSTAA